MHHALELPAAYSQMEVPLWPRNEIIYTEVVQGSPDIQTTTGVVQVFSGLHPVLDRELSCVLTRLTTIQEVHTLYSEG